MAVCYSTEKSSTLYALHCLLSAFSLGEKIMARINPSIVLKILIMLLVFLSACAQAPEPTQAPTNTPVPTPTPAPVEKQVTIIPSQVVVDGFDVAEPDPDTGEIEVVVQGSTSNTCTTVEGVTVSRDGEVFSVQIETKFSPGPDCEEMPTQFEEAVYLDAANLEPGSYLVTSGIVQSFEIEDGQPAEKPGDPTEGTSEEVGTSTEEETATTETGTAETTTPVDEPTSDEPRDCQDSAIFVADITYPDNTEVAAGEVFTKTWEIRNEGTCTWGSGYELEFVSGTFIQADPLDDPFPTVPPTDSVELSAVVAAPGTAGTHSGTWVLKRPEGDNVETQDGQAFDFWAIVVVPGGGTTTTTKEPEEIDPTGVVCARRPIRLMKASYCSL